MYIATAHNLAQALVHGCGPASDKPRMATLDRTISMVVSKNEMPMEGKAYRGMNIRP